MDRRGPSLGDARLLARAVRSAPFWLVTEGETAQRRVLIAGACWIDPRGAVADEAAVEPGARVTVTGIVREEQLPAGGYRDSVVETMRGEPGAVVWIRRAE